MNPHRTLSPPPLPPLRGRERERILGCIRIPVFSMPHTGLRGIRTSNKQLLGRKCLMDFMSFGLLEASLELECGPWSFVQSALFPLTAIRRTI